MWDALSSETVRGKIQSESRGEQEVQPEESKMFLRRRMEAEKSEKSEREWLEEIEKDI